MRTRLASSLVVVLLALAVSHAGAQDRSSPTVTTTVIHGVPHPARQPLLIAGGIALAIGASLVGPGVGARWFEDHPILCWSTCVPNHTDSDWLFATGGPLAGIGILLLVIGALLPSSVDAPTVVPVATWLGDGAWLGASGTF